MPTSIEFLVSVDQATPGDPSPQLGLAPVGVRTVTTINDQTVTVDREVPISLASKDERTARISSGSRI